MALCSGLRHSFLYVSTIPFGFTDFLADIFKKKSSDNVHTITLPIFSFFSRSFHSHAVRFHETYSEWTIGVQRHSWLLLPSTCEAISAAPLQPQQKGDQIFVCVYSISRLIPIRFWVNVRLEQSSCTAIFCIIRKKRFANSIFVVEHIRNTLDACVYKYRYEYIRVYGWLRIC